MLLWTLVKIVKEFTPLRRPIFLLGSSGNGVFFIFMAISQANHTQVSNDFLDNYLYKVGGSAAQVFLVITRQTTGWHKTEDKISLTQIQKKTGISRQGIIDAVVELEEKGLIIVNREGNTNSYSINYLTEDGQVSIPVEEEEKSTSQLSRPNQSTELTRTSQLSRHTKEKKETITKEISINRDEKIKLRQGFKDAFKMFNEKMKIDIGKEWNWGIQGKHLEGLIKRVMGHDEPMIFARDLLLTFAKLVKSKNNFWSGQPFNPQTLNSEGIYSRVVLEMNKTQKSEDMVEEIFND